MIYAVIDTNVLVSALFTKNVESATVKVLDAMLKDNIVPLYNVEILHEYAEVLNRPKFRFSKELVDYYLKAFEEKGLSVQRSKSHNDFFPDPKDVVFYEVALSKEDAYLVTGNLKHFPKTPIVVTPAEMLEILEGKEG